MLRRLQMQAEDIWSRQVRPYKWSGNKIALRNNKPMLEKGQSMDNWHFPEPVFISGMTPLSQWVAHDGIETWWESDNTDLPYKKVPAWKKPELIAMYLENTRAVLFIDDAHKLSNRKLQIAKACFNSAFRAVVAADDENRIPPSLRMPLLDSEPQFIRLNTDTAYDATNIVMLIAIVVSVLIGSTELAMLLGGFHFLSGGRRAGRQD